MDDAADAEAVIHVRVARLAALQAAAPLHGNRPGLRGSRRQTPVRRIDHQRSTPRRRVVFAPVRDRGIRPVALCRRARRPAPDRARRGCARPRGAWRIPRRSGTAACRIARDARTAHRIRPRSSTRPATRDRPTAYARSTPCRGSPAPRHAFAPAVEPIVRARWHWPPSCRSPERSCRAPRGRVTAQQRSTARAAAQIA